jgi:hypothetical protein
MSVPTIPTINPTGQIIVAARKEATSKKFMILFRITKFSVIVLRAAFS